VRPLSREEVCPLNPKPGAPRVAIFSYWNAKYAPLADIARPNWKAYAERHGYALRFYPGEYHEDPSRPETYGDKGRFELYYDLRGYVDIVVSLDIDSLFMNEDVTVEDTLAFGCQLDMTTFAAAKHHVTSGVARRGGLRSPMRPPLNFLWTFAESGPMSGLWIARTDDTTERHLRFAYAKAAIENNVRHGRVEPNGVSDQDAMTRLMAVPPFAQTFGSCFSAAEVGFMHGDTYSGGDWIMTCRGGSVGEKLATMKEFAAHALTAR
jgi:hypothetical protein